MTQEEKDLLLKDLSARLYYGVKIDCRVYYFGYDIERAEIIGLKRNLMAEVKCKSYESYNVSLEDYYTKIYLRPMSSMTEEEAFEMFRTVFHQVSLIGVDIESDRFRFKMVDSDGHFAGHTILFFDKIYSLEQSDWLLSHHFDYRGLIEKGLVLEAPEGMYKD